MFKVVQLKEVFPRARSLFVKYSFRSAFTIIRLPSSTAIFPLQKFGVRVRSTQYLTKKYSVFIE